MFQISMNFHRELDTESIKQAFNKSIDWIHYMPNCWFVLTTSAAERWYERLFPLLGDTDTLVITEVDPANITCWIQNWVIDWLHKSQERIEKSRQPS